MYRVFTNFFHEKCYMHCKLIFNNIYSVEIPKICSFVIEFIIAKYFKGSTCFERHTAHHQGL
jgi:hypothetical protein